MLNKFQVTDLYVSMRQVLEPLVKLSRCDAEMCVCVSDVDVMFFFNELELMNTHLVLVILLCLLDQSSSSVWHAELALSRAHHADVLEIPPCVRRSVPSEDSYGCVPLYVYLDGLRLLWHCGLPGGKHTADVILTQCIKRWEHAVVVYLEIMLPVLGMSTVQRNLARSIRKATMCRHGSP